MRAAHQSRRSGSSRFYEQVTLVKGFFSVFVFIGHLFLFWLFRMLFSTVFLYACMKADYSVKSFALDVFDCFLFP
jgi:hypothetical protein